jgi:hypothetical protein
MAESVIGLFKTELHSNPVSLARNGGPWPSLSESRETPAVGEQLSRARRIT